jgi:integrase
LSKSSLSLKQVLAVLAAARVRSESHWLMFALTFNHGLRASETVGLTPNNFRDGYLTVQRLKGSLKTTHPLFAHRNALLNEKPALIAMLHNTHGNERLFHITRQYLWKLFRKYARAAGVPAHLQHPHVLKHSLCQQLIESAGIHRTQRFVGHKNMSSTGIYLGVDDDEASAAAGRALGARPS